MKKLGHFVLLVTVGLLTPQLSLVSKAQVTPASGIVTDMGNLAPHTVAGNSHSRGALKAGDPVSGETNQPGRAGGTGDPSLGGKRHPLYRLAKSDTVSVTFTFSPELNETLVVQPDGFVALRGAGMVLAEGLTIDELRQAVARAYTGVLHEPEVGVALKDFEQPYFLASGEVLHPGKYTLRTDLTVTEAIAVAGGFSQQAKHSQVVLFRRAPDGIAEAKLVDLKKMLRSRDLNEDLHLRPGDFIYVPQNRISKIRKYVPASALSWYLNPLQF